VQKDFAGWHIRKLAINSAATTQFFREREIWWTAVGYNVGIEEDGKGAKYSRPVLVLRKLGRRHFYGLPLSTTKAKGTYYFPITTLGVHDNILLAHMREFDARRLANKIGSIDQPTYDLIIEAFIRIIKTSHMKK
jgi:hypothetical protein